MNTLQINDLIQTNIYNNSTGAITGQILLDTLLEINQKDISIGDFDTSLRNNIESLNTSSNAYQEKFVIVDTSINGLDSSSKAYQSKFVLVDSSLNALDASSNAFQNKFVEVDISLNNLDTNKLDYTYGSMDHENLAAWDSVWAGVPTYASGCTWETYGDYITVSYIAAYGVGGWLWTRYSLPKTPLDGYEVSGTAILRNSTEFSENTLVSWKTKLEVTDLGIVKVFAFRKNDGTNFASGDHVNITFTYRWK